MKPPSWLARFGPFRPPLVTAIVIVYNGERFLAEAIDSILAQTYRPIEILIVDDGSTDGSAGIARGYARRHDFIRCLQHEGGANRGMSASRNLGLRHARGEYVGFLDADDVWLARKLETEVELFRKHPRAGMVCGSTLVWFSWTSDPWELGQTRLQKKWRDGQPKDLLSRVAGGKWEGMVRPPRLLRLHLRQRNSLPHMGGALVRRRAALKCGGFEEAFRSMFEDQVFLSKLALSEVICVTPECFSKYRQHGGSACSLARRQWTPDSGTGDAEPMRMRYLRWLEGHVGRSGRRHRRIRQVIRDQLGKHGRDGTEEPGEAGGKSL